MESTELRPMLKSVGILEQQTLMIVQMRRSEFMDVVEEVIENATITPDLAGYSVALRDGLPQDLRCKLLDVASTMILFPFGEWLNATRGCGCLVGEYMLEISELPRAEFVATMSTSDTNQSFMTAVLTSPLGNTLATLGCSLDTALRSYLQARMTPSVSRVQVIEIVND